MLSCMPAAEGPRVLPANRRSPAMTHGQAGMVHRHPLLSAGYIDRQHEIIGILTATSEPNLRFAATNPFVARALCATSGHLFPAPA